MFRTYVEATETGALSTIGISTAASASDETSQAALLISAIAGGKSMIGLVADQIYMTDGAGNKAYPFVFSGGVMRVDSAYIRNLDAVNFTAAKIDAKLILQNGSLITDLFALNTVCDSRNNSFSQNISSDAASTWVTHASISIPARDQNTPIDLALSYSGSVKSSNIGSLRLLMRVYRSDGVEVTETAWTGPFVEGTSTVSGASGPFRIYDTSAPTAAFTYSIQTRLNGTIFDATGAGSITAVWWKR